MCPECLHTIPAGKVLAYSNDLACAECKKPLEISALSRNIAAFAGLIAAVIVWWFALKHYAGDPWALAWILPIVFSYFAFSIITPLVLALIADLEIGTEVAAPVHHEAPAHHSSH